MALKLSNDRKVSPFSILEINKSYPKGRHKPLVPNSFGLPAGPDTWDPEGNLIPGSCPDATDFCKKCYASNLERAFPSAGRLVKGNFEQLQACGSNVDKMVGLLATLMDDYRLANAKVERKLRKETGDPTVTIPKVFRIHWDGDFYSKPYTAAWALVIRLNKDVQFWVYTRTYEVVPLLAGIGNLAVYLSVDRFNLEAAKDCKALNPWVMLAFCGEDWTETEKLALEFPEERKGPKCPALTKKLPLVNDDGVGACVDCGMCLFAINNVRFSTKH